jgi:hypothetical protein
MLEYGFEKFWISNVYQVLQHIVPDVRLERYRVLTRFNFSANKPSSHLSYMREKQPIYGWFRRKENDLNLNNLCPIGIPELTYNLTRSEITSSMVVMRYGSFPLSTFPPVDLSTDLCGGIEHLGILQLVCNFVET